MKRNITIYLLLLFSSLIFVYFFGGIVPYMFFHTMLMLPVVSLMYILVIFFRFKYSQDIDKKFVVKGDKVNFLFNVTNEDPLLYPFMKISFCGADTIFSEQFDVISFSVPPYRKKSFSLELNCKYRGSYQIGIKSIEIMDFLGILKLSYKVFDPKSITVYPKIVSLERFDLKTDFQSESHSVLNSRHEDMTTILDVRKYEYGDSLKKIHWKLTAKEGELMVKKFQSTSETSAILMLDLMMGPYNDDINIMIEDKLIEAVVAVVHYCLQSWIPVTLVCYNEEILTFDASNPLAFEELYSVLAKIGFHQDVYFKDIMDVYLKDRINKTNIILFTSNLDYGLYDQIHKTNSSGYDVTVIYVSGEQTSGSKNTEVDNMLQSLPEIGVNAYKLDINDDIKTVLERR